MIFWTCIPISCLLMYLLWVNSCLACERSSGLFQPGEGLLRDCEIFAKIRCQLYPCICCIRSVAREIIKEDGVGRGGLLGKGITATMGRNGFFNMVTCFISQPSRSSNYHVPISGLLRVLPHHEDADAILLRPWHGILSQGGVLKHFGIIPDS